MICFTFIISFCVFVLWSSNKTGHNRNRRCDVVSLFTKKKVSILLQLMMIGDPRFAFI